MIITHVAVYVDELERAARFYETYFAATRGEKYHNPRTGLQTYFLTFDGGARLELMTRPDTEKLADDRARGWNHIAFAVGSVEEVDGLTDRLAQAGHPVVSGPRTTGDGYYESVVRDTEGNLVEITV